MSAEPVKELVKVVRATAGAYRLGTTARGNELLVRLTDGLFAHLRGQPELAARLAPLVAEVLAAQQRGDPIGLADRLEFELAPALAG